MEEATIQLSSLNFETVTRGELSQLAEYCLELKISASTPTNEATFCLIQLILCLVQVISAAGGPFSLLFAVAPSLRHIQRSEGLCRRRF